jgi:hypothetical protein
MTIQQNDKWMKYIPKKWKAVTIFITCVFVPVSPFIAFTANSYLDSRIEMKLYPIVKTQDTINIQLQSQKIYYENLNKGMEQLNTNVAGLQKWLIENNRSNRDF